MIEKPFKKKPTLLKKNNEIMTEIFTKSMKGKFPDFGNYLVMAEGGRTAHYYIVAMISEVYSKAKISWIYPDILCHGFTTISNNHNVKWFMICDKKSSDKYFNHFVSNPNILKKIEKFTVTKSNNVVKLLNTDFSTKTNTELKEICNQFFTNFLDFMYAAGGTMRVFDWSVRIYLEDQVKDSKVIYSVFHPKKISFSLMEEMETLQMAAKFKENKIVASNLKKNVEKLWKKYCFMNMGYYNEKPKPLQDYIDQIIKIASEENPREMLKVIKFEIKDTKAEKEAARNVHGAKIKKLAEIVGYAQYIKDLYKYNANRVQFHADGLFMELSKRFKHDVESIKDLTPNEIILLLDGKKIDWNYTHNRALGSVTTMLDSRLYECVTDVVKYEEEIINKKVNSSRTNRGLSGRVSYQGKITGSARVILGKNEFSKLQDGDILVVMNTSPDFVPILKKIRGIIAEEGGLTAHVNIISREFKIPCVVGVTGATSILKDGDKIELDAVNGIIKKIER